jgi:hypothetical protein
VKETPKNTAEEHSASSPHRSKETKVALRSAAWCLIWATSLTLSEIMIINQLIPESLFWPVALFPAALSVWMFYQFYLFYVGIDEFARKIQSDGLVIGFGLGMFILIVFSCLSSLGIPGPNASDMLVVFALCYVVGQLSRTLSYSR